MISDQDIKLLEKNERITRNFLVEYLSTFTPQNRKAFEKMSIEQLFSDYQEVKRVVERQKLEAAREKEMAKKKAALKKAGFKPVAVDWTEYERGWGQRHDGTTFYDSYEEANAAVKKYKDSLPSAASLGGVPDCYVMPGSPRAATVEEQMK